MPESAQHVRLVRALCKWIAEQHLDGDLGLVLSDTAGNRSADRSPRIDGYVPDAFVRSTRRYGAIVGEAKTASDLENRHSLAQILAFLRFCQQAGGLLVLAVPWYRAAYVKNVLALWSRRKGIDVSCCTVLDFLQD